MNTFGCPFENGDIISCRIQGVKVPKGEIYITSEALFILNNEVSGSEPNGGIPKKEYEYSWVVCRNGDEYSSWNTWEKGIKENDVTDIMLAEEYFPKIDHSIYKIGEKVVITDYKQGYDDYKKAFKALGFKKEESNCVFGSYEGQTGHIFAVTKHEMFDVILLAVEMGGGSQILISEKGVKPFEETKSVFRKGEYIVLLYGYDEKSFVLNHCYKQRRTDEFLVPEKDSSGSIYNGWGVINPDKPENWRYATTFEAEYYEKNGGPYDTSDFIQHDVQAMAGSIGKTIKERFVSSRAKVVELSNGKWYQNLKKGDYVVCTKVSSISHGIRKSNYVYQIHKDYDGTIHYLCNATSDCYDEFRLATDEEIQMFKDNLGPCDVGIKAGKISEGFTIKYDESLLPDPVVRDVKATRMFDLSDKPDSIEF